MRGCQIWFESICRRVIKVDDRGRNHYLFDTIISNIILLVLSRGNYFLVRMVDLREDIMKYSRRHKRIYLYVLLALLMAAHPLLGHTVTTGFVFCLESTGQLQLETSSNEISCDNTVIPQMKNGISTHGSSFYPSPSSHCYSCVDLPFVYQDSDHALRTSGKLLSHLLTSLSKPELVCVEMTRERSHQVSSCERTDSNQLQLVFLSTTILLIWSPLSDRKQPVDPQMASCILGLLLEGFSDTILSFRFTSPDDSDWCEVFIHGGSPGFSREGISMTWSGKINDSRIWRFE